MNQVLVFLRRFLWHILIVGIAFYTMTNVDRSILPSVSIKGAISSVLSMMSSSGETWGGRRRRDEESTKKKEAVEAALLKQGTKLIAETCSPNTNFCYLITDTAVMEGNELVVKRGMVLKDMPKYMFTIVELQKPELLSWSNFNTRHWPVNKLVVPSRYCKIMIAASFFTEAMSLEPVTPQKVLMIGLGGGVTSNFLSVLDWMKIETTVVELDPFVASVARQYFDHDDELRTRVIVDDGVKQLEMMREKGQKFHSLMLDACYNDDHPTLCPVEEFGKSDVIANMAAVLEEGGVLTVNVISTRDNVAHEQELLKLYAPHFPSCHLFKYLPERQMLICSKRENWTWEQQKARFRKNLVAVDDTFDFQISKLFVKD